MDPNVVGVRQNLQLLVDNGQVNPQVNSDDKKLWGVTVKNAYFVWRSGIGVTADGNIVYAMGPALSVPTLAELFQRAGAVRGMELDINQEWVSYMTYDGSKNPATSGLDEAARLRPDRAALLLHRGARLRGRIQPLTESSLALRRPCRYLGSVARGERCFP